MRGDETLNAAAARALDAARGAGVMLATAESCTGGMVAAALTAVAGASDVFDGGFVTYSNAAKTQMLGVPAALIDAHGAVSGQVALAMVEGASGAGTLAVSITGVAGPGGGTEQKPVGLVYIAVAGAGIEPRVREHRWRDAHPEADRDAIRRLTAQAALAMLADQALARAPSGAP